MPAACAAGHVSLCGWEAAWMLLSYQPTEVQEPPEACYSRLMHSLHLPLHLCSLSVSRSLSCSSSPSLSHPFFPKLSPFSMSCCPLHLQTFPLPRVSQVLTTLLQQALSLLLALTCTRTRRNCGSNHNSVQPPPHSSKALCKCLWLALTHILI